MAASARCTEGEAMTFTLPKWAALIIFAIFWPGLSAVLCVWFFVDSGYNWTGVASGILLSIAIRESLKLKRIFLDE